MRNEIKKEIANIIKKRITKLNEGIQNVKVANIEGKDYFVIDVTSVMLEPPANWKAYSFFVEKVVTSFATRRYIDIVVNEGQDNISEESQLYHERPDEDSVDYLSEWYSEYIVVIAEVKEENNNWPQMFPTWGRKIVDTNDGFIYVDDVVFHLFVYDAEKKECEYLKSITNDEDIIYDFSGMNINRVKELLSKF